MKFKIVIFLLIIANYSCDNGETSAKKDAHYSDSLSKAWDKQLQEDRDACNKLTNDTSYRKLFSAHCPGDTTKNPPFCSFKKLPFDTVITKTKDTIIYSFKVSNICCSRYYANYKINADTLILSYNYCGDECDCDCDYHLTYKVPTRKYKYKFVVFRTDQEPRGFTN